MDNRVIMSGLPNNFRQEWIELYDIVSGTSSSSGRNGCLGLSDLRGMLIEGGWRPKAPFLNILLDAVGLKWAELERKSEGRREEDHANQRSTRNEVAATAPDTNEQFQDDPDLTCYPSAIKRAEFPTDVEKTPCKSYADATTDEEDAAFSPQLFPYKKKLKAVEKSQSILSTPPRPFTSTQISSGTPRPLQPLEEDTPTPDKLPIMEAYEAQQLKNQLARRQLNLDDQSQPLPCPRKTKTLEIPELNKVIEVGNDGGFLEDSIITLDATPPVTPEPPSIIKSKRKEAWIDLRENSTEAKSKSKNRTSKEKQYKQTTLMRIAMTMPKKTMDISKSKEFNGGFPAGSQSHSQQSYSSIPKATTEGSGLGVKRKSDESEADHNFKNAEKRDKADTATSSKPQRDPLPEKQLSPKPGPSKKMPLSPINKIPPTDKPCKPSTSCNDKLDFTYDLLKDFDKIPEKNVPAAPFRYKEPTVRKKDERAKLPGWDCDDCRGYYELLASQMDEKEIERIRNRCSRHRSKQQVVSNTPENFWDTQFPSTEELYKDYIPEGTPFRVPAKYRRPRRSSESD